jgi:hypothetical protein
VSHKLAPVFQSIFTEHGCPGQGGRLVRKNKTLRQCSWFRCYS